MEPEPKIKNFGSATLISTILTSKCFKCLPEERGHMLIVKGQSATEESVEDHTAGPDVHLGTSVQLTRYNLHTHIVHTELQTVTGVAEPGSSGARLFLAGPGH